MSMTSKHKRWRSQLLSGLLSVAMAVTLIPAVGSLGGPAFAGEDYSAAKELGKSVEKGNETYNFATSEDAALAAQDAGDLPAAFDMRDKGWVTPVKFQNPFGTCWGFAAIAASESSILSSGLAQPEDLDEFGLLDLSEKHLAYFVTQPVDDKDSSQYGEGIAFRKGMSTQDKFNVGGEFLQATSLFSSGIGPDLENREYPASSGKTGSMEPILGYHGADKIIESKKIEVKKNGQPTGQFKWVRSNYSANDNWDIDHEYRYLQSYKLSESSCLPSPAEYDLKTGYHYNAAATEAFKKELMDGRAISIAFKADSSVPNQEDKALYISPNWAHYTYEMKKATHGVTIVGWDDNYSKANFKKDHQPPADGAWLVKNSWGSDEVPFPNNGYSGWGMVKTDKDGNPILDKDGNEIHTGYFWLSYYDQSLEKPETFEYDRSNVGSSYFLDQYDLMPSDQVYGFTSKKPVCMGNLFTCQDGPMDLEQVSCQTTKPNTQVDYNIYLLPEDATSPDGAVLMRSMSATYDFGGFHKITLPEPLRIQKDQSYFVEVVQRAADGYHVNLSKSHNETLAKEEGIPFWFNGVINPGESFLYLGGKYWDLSDKKLQQTLLGTDYLTSAIDNFPVKAYLQEVDSDIAMVVLGNTQFTLGEDPATNAVQARMSSRSDIPEDVQVVWTAHDPDIATAEPNKMNDTRCTLIRGTKAGIAYFTAESKGVGTVVFPAVVCPAKEKASVKTGKKKSRKLTVKFSSQKEAGIDKYEVHYRVKGTSKWKTTTAGPDKTSVVLKQLKKGKRYEVQVRAIKISGSYDLNGNWSESVISGKIK